MASSLLASVSQTLNVYEARVPELRPIVKCSYSDSDSYCDLAWNHTNQVIAVGGASRVINLFQVSNGSLLTTIPFSDDNKNTDHVISGDVTALGFSSSSRYLAAASAAVVYLYDLKRRNCKLRFIGHRGDITALTFLNDAEVLAGDGTGSMRIWSLKNETSSAELLKDNKAGLSCMQLAPLGQTRIASGYTDGALYVWDTETLQSLRKQVVHTGPLTGLAYSPKNPRLIATVGLDGRLALVDTGSKSLGAPSAFIDISDRLTTTSFYDDAIHCAVGTNSGSILLYDWRNVKKPVCKVDAHSPFPVRKIAFCGNRNSSLPSEEPAVGAAKPAASSASSVAPDPRSAAAPLMSPRMPAKAQMPPESLSMLSKMTPFSPARTVGSAVVAQPPPSAVDYTMSTLSDLSFNTSLANNDALLAFSIEDQIEGKSLVLSPKSLRRTAAGKDSKNRTPLPLALALPANPPSVPGNANNSGNKNNSSNSSLASIASELSIIAGEVLPLPPPAARAFRALAGRAPSQDGKESSLAPREAEMSGSPNRKGGGARARSPISAHKKGTDVSIANTSAVKQNISHTTTSHNINNINNNNNNNTDEFGSLRSALKPVTTQELTEALALLRYDVHREVQEVVREQVRQFAISKKETTELVMSLGQQLNDLLRANEELRRENEKLRKLY